MNEPKYERDVILNELRNNVIEVSFDKDNGQPRVMRCTLMKYFLPESYKEQADVNFHAGHPNVLAVWDIDNQGWRSFKIDSVRMVQALDPLLFKQ